MQAKIFSRDWRCQLLLPLDIIVQHETTLRKHMSEAGIWYQTLSIKKMAASLVIIQSKQKYE